MNHNSNNLLASIAVFAELCNTEDDIQGILSEFIKSTYAIEKSWSLDSLEMASLLKQHFDFDIPEAVVRTCLNSLVKSGFVTKSFGKYSVIDTSFNAQDFTNRLNYKKNKQKDIEDQIVKYYEEWSNSVINEIDKKGLTDAFVAYLLDNSVSDKFSTIISSFIMENSVSDEFVVELNQIKEGLVLLTGLKYTDDLNNLGLWTEEMTIYLDTEHLFNCVGYNGILYQRLFDDFTSLVNEVNAISKKKNGKKLIYLKYFVEVKEEIQSFFWVADRIVRKEDNASPENDAMAEICSGCIEPSDIVKKKTLFERSLKMRAITVLPDFDYHQASEYNIEDLSLIAKYEGHFEEGQVAAVLSSFSKINFLRKGKNRTSFEKCKHIILTGKTITRQLSQDLDIKNERKDIPFATDIYFITNRLWYKLNKGFSKTNGSPATLDFVTKARVVLASQVNKSIDKKYNNLKEDLKNGQISKEDAQDLYYNLRERSKKPEEISLSNLSDSVEFIFEDDLEGHIREKSELRQRAKEGEKAIIQLRKIKSEKLHKKKRPFKVLIRAFYFISITLSVLFVLAIPYGLWLFVKDFSTSGDTPIGIIGFLIATVLEIFGLIKYIKPFHNLLQRKSKRWYLDFISNIN